MKYIVLPSYSIRASADLHGKVSIFGYSTPIWVEISDLHTLRVETDLGSVRNESVTQAILEGLIENDLYDATKLLFTPETGIKTRATTVANTPLTFVSKGYSLDPIPNDLTQTTELNQPYLSGNIAPNERYAVKQQGADLKSFMYSELNYLSPNNLWSATFVFCWSGHNFNTMYPELIRGPGPSSTSVLKFSNNGSGFMWVTNALGSSDSTVISSRQLIGKNTILTLLGVGTNIQTYINGVLVRTSNMASDWRFHNLFVASAILTFGGKVNYFRIQDGAMTPEQVQAEHTFLRSQFPEIESVKIGDQTWATSNLEMVATPMGNVIPEVQNATDWANRQQVYNDAIAGGATVQEATRQAAAWCYYNNDPNLGAVYGKNYNRFAAKLLSNDIAAYNVANPATPWGWNVPTRAQLTTLSAQGGNASKVGGTNYWTNANGANSNGLTLLGSGIRQADGTFAELKATTGLLCRDADFARKVLNADDTFDEAAVTLDGFAIRLIKD